jgi:hypothetical protein
MSENIISGLGTTIAVSATLPATETEAGYEALTFTTIGEVTEIPEYGAQYEVVTHTPLATGVVNKRHGSVDYGEKIIPMALDNGDAGQIVLKAALTSRDPVAVKVEFVDGAIDYYTGIVTAFRRSASVGEVVTASVTIALTKAPIEVAA